MASEQAKALATEILKTHDIIGRRPEEVIASLAGMIDAAFMPPCPQCGAAIKPCYKWICGSWDEAGARQTSVKCVKRQMAEKDAKIEGLEADNTAMAEKLLRPAEQPPVPPVEPVEPEDQIIKGGEIPEERTPPPKVDERDARIEELEGLLTEQGFYEDGDRQAPDAMR